MSIRKRIPFKFPCAAVLSIVAGAACYGASAQTLKAVKDRGAVICGVSHGLPGFAVPDAAGEWTGIDVDFCRAVAAAIFNDPKKVQFRAALPSTSVSTRSNRARSMCWRTIRPGRWRAKRSSA